MRSCLPKPPVRKSKPIYSRTATKMCNTRPCGVCVIPIEKSVKTMRKMLVAPTAAKSGLPTKEKSEGRNPVIFKSREMLNVALKSSVI